MSETVDLCLVLPEDDPFYQHKKGLGVKESLNISGSIANLDKVEVYFGEDACSSAEVYSFRNEIAALRWILSLITVSCNTQTQIDSLEDVQAAVRSRISEVVGVEKERTRVDDSYICENEIRLVQWEIDGYGRGAIATEHLKFGDVALEIPVSSIISKEYVYNSDMYTILEKIDGMTSETMLLLWTMREKHNPKSKLKPYFDSLREKFCTGLGFGVLDGTLLLQEIMQAKEEIFHYGLPTPLLNYLRSAHGLVHHSETDLWKNLEVEMGMLENLRSTFDDMMQNLGDTDSSDRENLDWDVKMAMEFKEKQRKIVSSILDSCSAGINLVQDAMIKPPV